MDGEEIHLTIQIQWKPREMYTVVTEMDRLDTLYNFFLQLGKERRHVCCTFFTTLYFSTKEVFIYPFLLIVSKNMNRIEPRNYFRSGKFPFLHIEVLRDWF